MSVRERESVPKFGFRQFLGRTFDHNYFVFGTNIDKVEIALSSLRVRWVRDELAVYPANAHSANWASKGNVRNAQGGGCAVHRQDVGIILTIGAEQNRDDWRIVKISLRKERTQRPVDHARRKRFLFRWAPFALEVAARKFSSRCCLFAVIDRERKEILAFFDGSRGNRADEHHGVAGSNNDGAVGESGDFARFD